MPAKTHADGLAMIGSSKTSAYFADRSILLGLIATANNRRSCDLPTFI